MKLLNRTVRNYLIYSVIILLTGIPVFYIIIEQLYIDDVDESLVNKKEVLRTTTRQLHNEHDIQVWLKMDDDISLLDEPGIPHKDSLYYSVHYEPEEKEMEPYRELSTWMNISGKDYHLIIRTSLVEREDMIIGIAQAQAILLVIMLGGLLFINHRISRKVWKPFYDTVAKMEQFEVEKDGTLALTHSNIQEFEALNKAILHLTDRSHKAYLNQKEFTENASHEMQTPLAVFQSNLDILMQSKELTAGQAEIISRLYQTLQRLSRLYKSLLLLSKIENNQYVDTTPIAISEVVNQVIVIYEDQLQSSQLELHQEVVQDISVKVNPTLIEVLISNLVSNAIKYNIPGGDINIILKDRTLTVTNSGEALKSRPNILFERFKKDQAASAGTGLGLAIAEKICLLYGFHIRYSYSDERHSLQVVF